MSAPAAILTTLVALLLVWFGPIVVVRFREGLAERAYREGRNVASDADKYFADYISDGEEPTGEFVRLPRGFEPEHSHRSALAGSFPEKSPHDCGNTR